MELYELSSPQFKLTPQFIILGILGILTIGLSVVLLNLQRQGQLQSLPTRFAQVFHTPIPRVTLESEYPAYQLSLQQQASLEQLLRQRFNFSLDEQNPAEVGAFQQVKIRLTDTEQTKSITHWTDANGGTYHALSADYESVDEILEIRIFITATALEKFPDKRNAYLNEKLLTMLCQASAELSSGRLSATDICLKEYSHFPFSDTITIEQL